MVFTLYRNLPLCNLKTGKNEGKELIILIWGLNNLNSVQSKRRKSKHSYFVGLFWLLPTGRPDWSQGQNRHGVAPNFISIFYNHFIQLGTCEAQEQEERTVCPGTVLILWAKRRDNGDKQVWVFHIFSAYSYYLASVNHLQAVCTRGKHHFLI